MIDCIGRSAHTLLGHAILILSFSFPTISHPPEHSPCWSWIANVSPENSAEHETLSLSPNNAISPICSTSDSQQCFNNNSLLSSDSDLNDDKD